MEDEKRTESRFSFATFMHFLSRPEQYIRGVDTTVTMCHVSLSAHQINHHWHSLPCCFFRRVRQELWRQQRAATPPAPYLLTAPPRYVTSHCCIIAAHRPQHQKRTLKYRYWPVVTLQSGNIKHLKQCLCGFIPKMAWRALLGVMEHVIKDLIKPKILFQLRSKRLWSVTILTLKNRRGKKFCCICLCTGRQSQAVCWESSQQSNLESSWTY